MDSCCSSSCDRPLSSSKHMTVSLRSTKLRTNKSAWHVEPSLYSLVLNSFSNFKPYCSPIHVPCPSQGGPSSFPPPPKCLLQDHPQSPPPSNPQSRDCSIVPTHQGRAVESERAAQALGPVLQLTLSLPSRGYKQHRQGVSGWTHSL